VHETNDAFTILDRHLNERAYVLGDEFSMADIPLGAIAHRWFALEGIARPEWPALRRWFALLSARPGYEKHVMLPLS
jgi:glutathione S-transferase